MAKALLKNKQLHGEVFAEVDTRVAVETTRATTEEAELDLRIDNAISHVDGVDGIITSLVELMNATQIGDDYIIDAFRALGVEANATFGELITRLGNLEAKRLHRVSYEATGNSAAGAGQSGIPDGAGEPFDQVTQGAGPALVLQLDKHLAAYGITYDPSGGAPEDWRLDNNQVAIRVILNGEDLVEASAGDLQDGDFYLSAGAAENYLVVRHLHADDTITFELALRRIGEGTPVPEFDLDYDGDDDPSTGTQDGLDYVVPEAVEEAPVV